MIGYRLTILGDLNVPRIFLGNRSDVAEITAFHFSIGDTSYNWDFAGGFKTHGAGWALRTPDRVNDGLRSDWVELDFTSFLPGRFIEFRADLDPDDVNEVVDYRTVLFNNGSAPNATATVWFGAAGSLSQMLTDQTPSGRRFSWEQRASIDDVVVPEPTSLALLATGLAYMAVRRRRQA